MKTDMPASDVMMRYFKDVLARVGVQDGSSVAMLAMGFHVGLRLAKHYPEYVITISDLVEEEFMATKGRAEGLKQSWANRISQEMPKACPLEGDNGHEAKG